MENYAYLSNSDFCQCVHPDHDTDDWVSVGTGHNMVDFKCCGECGSLIRGTNSTHLEDEDEDE